MTLKPFAYFDKELKFVYEKLGEDQSVVFLILNVWSRHQLTLSIKFIPAGYDHKEIWRRIWYLQISKLSKLSKIIDCINLLITALLQDYNYLSWII